MKLDRITVLAFIHAIERRDVTLRYVLPECASRGFSLTPADAYAAEVDYVASNGWKLRVFNDCNSFDYIDRVEDSCGRVWDFDDGFDGCEVRNYGGPRDPDESYRLFGIPNLTQPESHSWSETMPPGVQQTPAPPLASEPEAEEQEGGPGAIALFAQAAAWGRALTHANSAVAAVDGDSSLAAACRAHCRQLGREAGVRAVYSTAKALAEMAMGHMRPWGHRAPEEQVVSIAEVAEADAWLNHMGGEP